MLYLFYLFNHDYVKKFIYSYSSLKVPVCACMFVCMYEIYLCDCIIWENKKQFELILFKKNLFFLKSNDKMITYQSM